jgi:hypothetical protein
VHPSRLHLLSGRVRIPGWVARCYGAESDEANQGSVKIAGVEDPVVDKFVHPECTEGLVTRGSGGKTSLRKLRTFNDGYETQVKISQR